MDLTLTAHCEQWLELQSLLGTHIYIHGRPLQQCPSSQNGFYIVISHPKLSLPDPAPESPAVSLMDRSRRMLGMKPESMDVPWSHNGVYSPIKQFASTLSAVPVLIYSCVSLRWHWWRRAVDFSSPVSRFNQTVWGAEGMRHYWRRERAPAPSPSKRALGLDASSQILNHSPCLDSFSAVREISRKEIHLFGWSLY